MCHPEKKKRWKEVGQGKLGLCALEVQSHILFRAHTQALTHTHTHSRTSAVLHKALA